MSVAELMMLSPHDTVAACSVCGALVYHPLSPTSEVWICDHGPYASDHRKLTDYEMLHEILERTRRIEQWIAQEQRRRDAESSTLADRLAEKDITPSS